MVRVGPACLDLVIKPCAWKQLVLLFVARGLRNIGAVTRMPRFPLPDKFSDGDYASFEKLFKRVATANAWTEEQKLSALPLCLHGRALSVFEKNEKKITTISEAFSFLEKEFMTSTDRNGAMKEFYLCKWGHGFDLDVYSQKLSQLLTRGFPSLNEEDRKRVLTNQFINGFPAELSDKLRLLFAGRTPDLAEAVAAAKDLVKTQATVIDSCAVSNNESMNDKLNAFSEKLQAVAADVASITSRLDGSRPRWDARTDDVRGRNFQSRHRLSNTGSRENYQRQARGVRCFNCSGFGHISRNCPSPRPRQESRSGNEATVGRNPTASLQ